MSPPRLIFTLLPLAFCLLPCSAAGFPTPTNNQPITNAPLTPPEKTIGMMHLPPGFKATLFAAEPDVQQPIAMCWDEKGRLWIAENYTYSDGEERFDMKLKDRILIFEDADNDGRFDKRTVFHDDLQMLTSIERGFGGVYALCPPHLLWMPAKDDKPAGPPQILLDGFSTTAASRHTFANGLKWGPDGWLYGRIGISSTSWIDVPGTPQEKRKPTAGGIWRYHPTRKIYEPYCHGTTNPWGMDWDEHGEMFFINTVIGHLWHGIHGAHFKRMHGEDPCPHIYDLIDQHADHYHWDTGEIWSDVRKIGVSESSSAKGGGHAHVGMMIYQGINWPKQYRGKIFTLNLHGHRVNVDRLERQGSGYVGKHEPDFMKTDDPWFRAVEIQYGPDGGVYILDWSDIGECHESDGCHRTSGRIYKITYGEPKKPRETDLTKLTEEELAKLQLSDNEWLVRMARWELRERQHREKWDFADKSDVVRTLAGKSPDARALLRLIWLQTFLGSDEPAGDWDALLKYPRLITAALRLFGDRLMLGDEKRVLPGARNMLRGLAGDKGYIESKSSPEIRLELASLLQKCPELVDLVAADLLSHAEDAADHNLPLMYWFGIRDLQPARLVDLFGACRIPLVRQFIARRAAEDIDKDPAPLNELLALSIDRNAGTPGKAGTTGRTGFQPVPGGILPPGGGKQDASRNGQDARAPNASRNGQDAQSTPSEDGFASDILAGMTDALKGWRKASKPETWDKFTATLTEERRRAVPALSANTKGQDAPSTFSMIRDLSILFGSGLALDEVRAIALDDKADIKARRSALRTLIDARPPDLRTICKKLLAERGLSPAAVQGLATYDDPAIAETIVKRYRNFYPHERGAVVSALTSRPSFARVLLKHIGENGIPRADITPVDARQIRSFNDPTLTKRLAEVWGEVRESTEEKKKLIAALKAKLTPGFIAKGDPSQGRVLFAGICAACHKLYGEGNSIGPDLTGSGRHDISYLVENAVDPSAVVAADFSLAVVTLKDGRVLNGIVGARTDRTITLKMVGMETTVDRNDVARQEQLPVSLMPEGQFTALNDVQLRDLVSYLMSNGQAPLPK